MIEKYGTDPKAIPASDGQILEIKKIASEHGMTLNDVDPFETYDEANALIDKLRNL